MKKVLVAMSGGIDSSVTAALLKLHGYEVGGITMRLLKTYPQNDPAIDAEIVAKKLGIKHHVIDIADFFENTVIKYFVNDYLKGNTPNPCVYCNKTVKFGLLFNQAEKFGYDYFATGHYAQIINECLVRGVDPTKDQSYFLYPIYGCNTAKILFPLGSMTKQEVRCRAEELGLHNAKKQDSQDICFVQDENYQNFLLKKCNKLLSSGHIVNTSGKVIGTHNGIHNYTIGQRKGLGALGKPMFVKQIVPLDNTVVVSDDFGLLTDSVKISDTVFYNGPVDPQKKYLVQVRYRSQAVNCMIDKLSESFINIKLFEPARAIAPGQSAVVYDGNRVIGGGIIVK